MDITVKKYEHRHLAMSVCEHECNVGRKYVLPQAQAFGLSWSMAMAGLADIHNNSWGRTAKKKTLIATDWQSSPDPTRQMMHDKGPAQVSAQVQVLE